MKLKIVLIVTVIFLSIIAYGAEEKIKFSFDNKEIIVVLENNSAAESLLEQLPLTLEFEDYSNIEK